MHKHNTRGILENGAGEAAWSRDATGSRKGRASPGCLGDSRVLAVGGQHPAWEAASHTFPGVSRVRGSALLLYLWRGVLGLTFYCAFPSQGQLPRGHGRAATGLRVCSPSQPLYCCCSLADAVTLPHTQFVPRGCHSSGRRPRIARDRTSLVTLMLSFHILTKQAI